MARRLDVQVHRRLDRLAVQYPPPATASPVDEAAAQARAQQWRELGQQHPWLEVAVATLLDGGDGNQVAHAARRVYTVGKAAGLL